VLLLGTLVPSPEDGVMHLVVNVPADDRAKSEKFYCYLTNTKVFPNPSHTGAEQAPSFMEIYNGYFTISDRHAPNESTTFFIEVIDLNRAINDLIALGGQLINTFPLPVANNPNAMGALLSDPAGNVAGIFALNY
jgi:hypothetical protein